jgi:hypothetical protein
VTKTTTLGAERPTCHLNRSPKVTKTVTLGE